MYITKVYISIDLLLYMVNQKHRAVKTTAINLNYDLYVQFRKRQPHANFSALVNTWLNNYVEELKKDE